MNAACGDAQPFGSDRRSEVDLIPRDDVGLPSGRDPDQPGGPFPRDRPGENVSDDSFLRGAVQREQRRPDGWVGQCSAATVEGIESFRPYRGEHPLLAAERDLVTAAQQHTSDR